jgi:hypothetical protein
MLFFQCDLSRGPTRTRGYIAARAAVVGKLVTINEPGFEGRWRVDAVGLPGVDGKVLKQRQHLHYRPFASIAGERPPA